MALDTTCHVSLERIKIPVSLSARFQKRKCVLLLVWHFHLQKYKYIDIYMLGPAVLFINLRNLAYFILTKGRILATLWTYLWTKFPNGSFIIYPALSVSFLLWFPKKQWEAGICLKNVYSRMFSETPRKKAREARCAERVEVQCN